jgi:hypothetical protein
VSRCSVHAFRSIEQAIPSTASQNESPVHTGKTGRKTRKAITEEANVQTSLDIHIKLNLDVDILVVAKIKRDVV